MKKIHLTILYIVMLMTVLPIQAQKRRGGGTERAATSQKGKTNELYQSLLPSTAKVMFVDSVVVGKADFLKKLPHLDNMGRMTELEGKAKVDGLLPVMYEDPLGDHRIFADGDSTGLSLFSQISLAKRWGKAEKIKEIDGNEYQRLNFPFLMSDGVTLYFSAKGKQSMGGYDIFMTTYDSDNASYYEPQNVGLPFNSTANDYLLAIDDIDSLGWLVTDRHQAVDSVCIYTFVPTATRLGFQSDNLSNKELERYANLRAIADTWKFGNRKAALQRLNGLLNAARQHETAQQGVGLVLSDNKTVFSEKELATDRGRKLFAQWRELLTMQRTLDERLSTLRRQFETGRTDALKQQILEGEEQQLQLLTDVHRIEKDIRRAEVSR